MDTGSKLVATPPPMYIKNLCIHLHVHTVAGVISTILRLSKNNSLLTYL